MIRTLGLILSFAIVAAACGGSGSGGSGPVEVTEASFDCILDGTKVRRFYVKNLLDDLEAAVAVAEGDAPLPYPRGTLLQLVPFEAMVKREAGFSEETNDWEFFFLRPTDQGTEIDTRGKDATNFLGDSCADCHSAAAHNDFVCETDNGCFSLPTPEELIISIQQADPRCR